MNKTYSIKRASIILEYLLATFVLFLVLGTHHWLFLVVLLFLVIAIAYDFGFRIVITDTILAVKKGFQKPIQISWEGVNQVTFPKQMVLKGPNINIFYKGLKEYKRFFRLFASQNRIIISSRIGNYTQLVESIIDKVPEERIDPRILKFVQKYNLDNITLKTQRIFFGSLYFIPILALIFLRNNLITYAYSEYSVYFPNVIICYILLGTSGILFWHHFVTSWEGTGRATQYLIFSFITLISLPLYIVFALRLIEPALFILIAAVICLILWVLIITWFPKLIFKKS